MKIIKGEYHSIKHNLKQPHIMKQSELRVWEANSPAAWLSCWFIRTSLTTGSDSAIQMGGHRSL